MPVDPLARPVLAVDFDGVIHEGPPYANLGPIAGNPAVPGAVDWLHTVAQVFRIVFFSSSADSDEAKTRIVNWLTDQGFSGVPYTVTDVKPPAVAYLDDRAIRFEGPGTFPSVKKILTMQPWWELPGVPHDAPAARVASAVAEAANDAEARVTPVVVAVAAATSGTVEGGEHRLKSVDAIEMKVEQNAAEQQVVPAHVGAQIHDALRYTIVYPDATYSSDVDNALAWFAHEGHPLRRFRNYWTPVAPPGTEQPLQVYYGMNAVLQSPDGYDYEVQFHTPESWRVNADENWPLYDRLRNGASEDETRQLVEEMRSNLAGVPVPPGAGSYAPPRPVPHPAPLVAAVTPVDIGQHNATTARAAARAWDELEPRLARLIEPVLRRAGRHAAQKFRTATSKTMTASAYRAADYRRLAALSPAQARGLLRSLTLTAAGVPGLGPTATMVAVMPTAEQAKAIAIGNQDPDILHVTLAGLDEYDGPLNQLAEVLGPVAASFAPLTGKVAGSGQFGDTVELLLPDVPGLVELRVAVTEALANAGVPYLRDHGYQPHITVDYLPGEIPAEANYREALSYYTRDCGSCAYFQVRGWCQMFGAPARADMVCDDWTDVPPPAVPAGAPLDFTELLIVRGNDEYIRLPLVGTPPLTAAGEGARGLQSTQTEATAAALLADETILESQISRALQSAKNAATVNALRSAQDQLDGMKRILIAAQHSGDPERIFNAERGLETAQREVRQLLSNAQRSGDIPPLQPPGPGQPQQPAQPVVQPPGHPQPAGPTKPLPKAQLPKPTEVSAELQKDKAQEAFLPEAGSSATTSDSVRMAGESLTQLLEQEAFAAPAAEDVEHAAVAPPDWVKPAGDEVLNTDDLASQVRGVTDPVRQAVIQSVATPVLDNVGIGWDDANPFAAKVLAQSASQVTAITETTQADVMDAINQAYQQGLSIDDTAKLIQAKMAEASPARARLIARTELAGAVNGGSLAATQIVSQATGIPYQKTWLTAPGAPHPRHELYPNLDGQVADLDGLFQVGDAQLKFPGDPDGPPEEVCSCRCSLIYAEGAQDSPAQSEQSPEDQALTVATPPAPTAVGTPKVENAPLHVRQLPPNIQHELDMARLRPEVTDVAVASDLGIAQNAATLDALQGAYAAKVPHSEMYAYDLWRNPSAGAQLQEALRAGNVDAEVRLTKGDFRGGHDGYKKTLKRFDDAGYHVDEHDHSFTVPVRDVVTNMDKIVDLAPLIEQPMTVYRGLPHSDLLFGKDGPVVGASYTEKGYTQATLDEKIATGYSRGGDGVIDDVGTGPPAVVKLGLAHEQQVLWGRPLNDRHHDVGVTLPRKTSYVVDSASQDSEGVWHVEAHVPDPVVEAQPFFLPGGPTLPPVTPVQPTLEAQREADEEMHAFDPFAAPPVAPPTPPPAEAVVVPGKNAPVREQAQAAQPFFFPGKPKDPILGITPFRAGEDNALGFYDTAKAQQFEADLKSTAEKDGLTITSAQHVTGVWEGETEPSYSVHMLGDPTQVNAFAEEMRARYNQDGVMVFVPEKDMPKGMVANASEYRIGPVDPREAVAKMQQYGLSGGTIRGHTLSVVSTEPSEAVKVASLAKGLGVDPADVKIRYGHVEFVSRPEDVQPLKPTGGELPVAPAQSFKAPDPNVELTQAAVGAPLHYEEQFTKAVQPLLEGLPVKPRDWSSRVDVTNALQDGGNARRAKQQVTDGIMARVKDDPAWQHLSEPQSVPASEIKAGDYVQVYSYDSVVKVDKVIADVQRDGPFATDQIREGDKFVLSKYDIENADAGSSISRFNERTRFEATHFEHGTGELTARVTDTGGAAGVAVGDVVRISGGDPPQAYVLHENGIRIQGTITAPSSSATAGDFYEAHLHDASGSVMRMPEGNHFPFPQGQGGEADRGYAATSISGLVDTWAGTSADSNPWAIAVQKATNDEFGLHEDAFKLITGRDESAVKAAEAIYAEKGAALRAFVRAQYENTQELLKAQGIHDVTVYRGMSLGELDNKTLESIPTGAHVDEVTLQPASSFSASYNTAKMFTNGESAIVAAQVPADRILSCPRTGNGCLGESEYVVLAPKPGMPTDQAYVYRYSGYASAPSDVGKFWKAGADRPPAPPVARAYTRTSDVPVEAGSTNVGDLVQPSAAAATTAPFDFQPGTVVKITAIDPKGAVFGTVVEPGGTEKLPVGEKVGFSHPDLVYKVQPAVKAAAGEFSTVSVDPTTVQVGDHVKIDMSKSKYFQTSLGYAPDTEFEVTNVTSGKAAVKMIDPGSADTAVGAGPFVDLLPDEHVFVQQVPLDKPFGIPMPDVFGKNGMTQDVKIGDLKPGQKFTLTTYDGYHPVYQLDDVNTDTGVAHVSVVGADPHQLPGDKTFFGVDVQAKTAPPLTAKSTSWTQGEGATWNQLSEGDIFVSNGHGGMAGPVMKYLGPGPLKGGPTAEVIDPNGTPYKAGGVVLMEKGDTLYHVAGEPSTAKPPKPSFWLLGAENKNPAAGDTVVPPPEWVDKMKEGPSGFNAKGAVFQLSEKPSLGYVAATVVDPGKSKLNVGETYLLPAKGLTLVSPTPA